MPVSCCSWALSKVACSATTTATMLTMPSPVSKAQPSSFWTTPALSWTPPRPVADGSYTFTGVVPGTYSVRFPTEFDGKTLVDANQGGNEAVDSDADPVTGETAPFAVLPNQTTSDIDAGIEEQPGGISGTYFCDEDRDGVDDGAANGDADVAGKTVMLFEADGVTPATDIDGNPVAEVQTDANGNYSFDNLGAGDYVVMFEGEDGKAFIDPNAGDDAIDSDVLGADGKTAPVSVEAGEVTENVDAGVEAQAGGISGTYFCDEDRDGVDDGAANGDADIAGKTVMLFEADGVTPATDIDGNPVAEVQTDANGNYSFGNLGAGDYVVMFEGVEGKAFIAPNAGP